MSRSMAEKLNTVNTLDGAEKVPPPEPARKTSTMDPTLRLAAKLDRLLAECPDWARAWAISWLVAKYQKEVQE